MSKLSKFESGILYSRVSSSKQKEDLKRQSEYLETNHVVDPTRRLLQKSLTLDQLQETTCVFGFELIEWLCSEYGTKIVVLDTKDTSPESELGKDLISIISTMINVK
jgi:putative resolvase